jgi:hypothetical protein
MAGALDWRLIGLLLERPRSGWIEEAEALAAETGHKDLRDAVQAARGVTEGTYLSLAFRPRAEDPLDHVAVEAGFIGYLCLKEAQALARGDEESAEITASARSSFIDDHLGQFADKWAERVSATGVPHLCAAAQALVDCQIGR